MKNFVVFTSILVFCLSTLGSVWALDIDTKMLATVLGVSETKRTILINKGSEQGVQMNTHAKFSLPFGMVARGIVVKVSPSRSVWSLYRVFHKDKIEKDIAVLLKVSSAVRLTEDESKDLGALADRVDQKKDRLNLSSGEFASDKKNGSKSMVKNKKGKSAYSKADFSVLEEVKKEHKRDSSVDWSGIDGKKDSEHFDRSQDYSGLH